MSDQLTIKDGKIYLTTEEGQTLERDESKLVDMLRDEFLPPLNGSALPDGVKFTEWRPPYFLVVHQMPPHVRQFRWIANDSPARFGPETKYRKVRLSIPYSITFAMYFQQVKGLFISQGNELYFRNEPLRSKEEKLCYPALLNISKILSARRNRAWVCTQYLRYGKNADWTGQLQSLLDHIWNGGFNLSSEDHEGASWYGESKKIKNIHPVEEWEKATEKDEAFGLSVPWLEAPLKVGELMDAMFSEMRGIQSAMPAPKSRRSKVGPKNLVNRFLNYALKK